MKRTLLVLLMALPNFVWSQTDIDTMVVEAPLSYDTNYVHSYYDKLVVTTVLSRKIQTIDVVNGDDISLNYSTHSGYNVGIGLDYKWLTFEFGTRIPFSGNDPRKGETDNFYFGFGVTGRRWTFRNFVDIDAGYYLTNPDVIYSGYLDSNGTYPIRKDMGSFSYLATLNYTFNNKKYSNQAALFQLERQKKSAGSFMLGAFCGLQVIVGDSSLVPSALFDQYPDGRDIAGMVVNTIGLNAGYAYNFSFGRERKLFANIALIPGISYQSGALIRVSDTTDAFAFEEAGIQTEFRLSAGYNGDDYYGGMLLHIFSINTALPNGDSFSSAYPSVRFYFGYRFAFKHNVGILKRIGL